MKRTWYSHISAKLFLKLLSFNTLSSFAWYYNSLLLATVYTGACVCVCIVTQKWENFNYNRMRKMCAHTHFEMKIIVLHLQIKLSQLNFVCFIPFHLLQLDIFSVFSFVSFESLVDIVVIVVVIFFSLWGCALLQLYIIEWIRYVLFK